MKTNGLRTSALLLLALSCAACASAPARDDVVDSINRQASSPANPGPSPAASDAKLAELQTSMTELLERMDVLTDRIQRLENGQTDAAPARSSESAVAAPVVAAPVPAPVPIVVTTPAPAPAPVAAPVAVEAVAPAPQLVRPRVSPSSAKPLVAAQIADSYRDAIVLFGKNRLLEARKRFQEVFDADTAGDLADNALFWIGETYFAANDFTSAMKYYRRVTVEYGDQNKAPDAMFKMGVAYEKSGDLGLAKQTFEECIKKYPYSSPASSARLELKRIKY